MCLTWLTTASPLNLYHWSATGTKQPKHIEVKVWSEICADLASRRVKQNQLGDKIPTSMVNQKMILVTSLPLNPYTSMHDKKSLFQKFREWTSSSSPPELPWELRYTDYYEMIYFSSFFQERILLLDYSTSSKKKKHTGKQVNPIQYTRQRSQSEKVLIEKSLRSFTSTWLKCPTQWTLSFTSQ